MAAVCFEPLSIVAFLVTIGLLGLYLCTSPIKGQCIGTIPSPMATAIPDLTLKDIERLPYPPDVLPGGRDVQTPYGSIRVYEWGPETGERVLLVHGVSLPCISLGDLARELVRRDYRVMLFGTLRESDILMSLKPKTSMPPLPVSYSLHQPANQPC